MNYGHEMEIETRAAFARLFDRACSDTAQARRAADFLIARWNPKGHGGFDTATRFRSIARSRPTCPGFDLLGQRGGAICPDAFGSRERMESILIRWRGVS